MNAECCKAPRRLAALLALVPAALVTIAVPKCPLCLAALLSLLGIGVGAAAAIAPLLLPFAGALAVLGVCLLLWPRRRARARPTALETGCATAAAPGARESRRA
jgi:hypothetical protein